MNEHMMELANEIARLKTENEKLKHQLNDSVPLHVVSDLKKQLFKALTAKDFLLRRAKRDWLANNKKFFSSIGQ